MLIDLNSTPREAWAVRRPGQTVTGLAYVCETEPAADMLADKHRAQYDEEMEVVPVQVIVQER